MVSRPKGEKSERRIEPVFLAGENGRGFEATAPSLFLTLEGRSSINPLFDLPIKEVTFIGFYRY
ncbi:MAG: hypothetical protein H6P98_250 [Candidatus Aminicenantes bacterium]|nr:hypothetical protein [Candidatus Aminicenantes bacterium]